MVVFLTECPSGQIACDGNRCIEEEYMCDGVFDCYRGDDEYDCPTDMGKLPFFDSVNIYSQCCNRTVDWMMFIDIVMVVQSQGQ